MTREEILESMNEHEPTADELIRTAREGAKRAAERARARHVRGQVEATAVENASGMLPTVSAFSTHERRTYWDAVAQEVKNRAEYATRRAGSALASKPPLTFVGEASQSISKDIGMVPPHGGFWLNSTARSKFA